MADLLRPHTGETVGGGGGVRIMVSRCHTVRKGQRLETSVYAGSITVKTWSRDAIRIQADTRRKDHLDVSADGSTVSIETSGKWGPAGNADIEITMPVWMPVELSGVETDLSVEGCKCTVHGETVRGDVSVKGGEGNVSVQSVEGSVTVTDVNGRVEAQSVNESVTVERVTGDLAVQTVNGDVTMVSIKSASVESGSRFLLPQSPSPNTPGSVSGLADSIARIARSTVAPMFSVTARTSLQWHPSGIAKR
jgi:hypothetical protein